MGQGSLFEFTVAGGATPAKALARASDPAPSHAAAAAILPHLGTLQALVLDMVRASPGKTSNELARDFNIADPRKINRRLGELERQGRVVRGEARECAVSGKRCATWRVKD